MPRRHLRIAADGAALRAGFAAVRAELGIPADFPADALAEAEQAAAAPRLPEADATDVPFVTIDPPGARDLDQALHLERRGTGYRVRYAIADIAAFVRPGGAVDRVAQERGETLYAPDLATPLHPPVLVSGAASLLPGQVRPALVWDIDLDATGEGRAVTVRRMLVRSREQLDYATVQGLVDAGRAPEPLRLLREVGLLRGERERDRGGLHLPVPEQEIVAWDGSYALVYRAPLPVEEWNAQISLLTGMGAAELMLYGEVGVLRTLPAADPALLARLRRTALALGVPWADDATWGQVVGRLDPSLPPHAALLEEATSLLRGAGYTAFDGGVPEQATHAAVGAEYAHVTAPLRRLVDRYAGEVCVALCADQPVPGWVRDTLPRLPGLMEASNQRAGALERACVELVEATVLRDRVGEEFDAAVVEANEHGGIVQLADPAVRAHCEGAGLPLGAQVRVRLAAAEPATPTVRFVPA